MSQDNPDDLWFPPLILDSAAGKLMQSLLDNEFQHQYILDDEGFAEGIICMDSTDPHHPINLDLGDSDHIAEPFKRLYELLIRSGRRINTSDVPGEPITYDVYFLEDVKVVVENWDGKITLYARETDREILERMIK